MLFVFEPISSLGVPKDEEVSKSIEILESIEIFESIEILETICKAFDNVFISS